MWICATHDEMLPLTILDRPDASAIEYIRGHAQIPLWLPEPMPIGWQLCGLAVVGDQRNGLRATVAAYRGPAPLGGTGEWLLVAEEPGIGLGASYARTTTVPAPASSGGPAPAKIHTSGHPTPLWPVLSSASDRSAYVGEAAGVWFWLISFPSDAGYEVLEDLELTDARHGYLPAIETGAPSQQLRPGDG